jgi:hypothetical protein
MGAAFSCPYFYELRKLKAYASFTHELRRANLAGVNPQIFPSRPKNASKVLITLHTFIATN